MLNLSQDTVAHIIANFVIVIVAIVGSRRAAIDGAQEGARATLAATKAFAEEQEQRQRASVRLRLRVEIDHNLANLRAIRDKLNATATPNSTLYAQAFVHGVMPAWTRQAWESMTALPAPALEPTEIEHVNHFYGQLETLSGIREQLTPMVNEKPHMEDFFGRGATSVQPVTLDLNGPRLTTKADKIMSDLIERGNPIAEA
jgi:hypothetical protein